MTTRYSKLSRNQLRLLQPGQKVSERGIEVTRTKKGDLSYTVAIMVDGRRIHTTLGLESEGVTRQQAEDAVAAFKTRAREGRLDLPTGRKTHRTFAEAAKEYLRRMESGGGKNMKAKHNHLGELATATGKKRSKADGPLLRAFGKYRADKVTTFDVQQYVQHRMSAGIAQATVNRELATLSHAFKRMIEWKWIKAEDAPAIKKGEEPRKAITVLSDTDIAALSKAAASDQDRLLGLFVACGLNTAMRHSEILRIRFDQIDFDARRIFVAKAKAGSREQPITNGLAAMLKAAQEASSDRVGWVFPSSRQNGKYPHRQSMAKQFLRAVNRAGLTPSKVTPHIMRHTAITTLVRENVDVPTIQKISGHKTFSMVLRYVHIHGRHIDDAIARLDTQEFAISQDLHKAGSATSAAKAA
ncbi:hypothetical protein AVT10_16545 [Sphingomonas hankookensis]|uniref:Integrase n=1 Tax=Sphingomonas hankookensis TaxID=563996 RepID=A0ABR5YCB2_9SPHN|nr:hypothetical protein AVT10_16545 [Sphingomonas hankookensis]PZT93426.1 MAG: site-specific integrase [Sphingomonas sp.]RSV31959.1 site-specific integrase [Sphingomonas sp. ABOLH]